MDLSMIFEDFFAPSFVYLSAHISICPKQVLPTQITGGRVSA